MELDWILQPFLSQSLKTVAHNFMTAGIVDPNIVFVKGFFSKTMRPLRDQYPGPFSLLRLDGDMYESTVDVLYHFYDKLSVGGMYV